MRRLDLSAVVALAALAICAGCGDSRSVVGGTGTVDSGGADVTKDVAPDIADVPMDREVRCGATQQNCNGVCVDLSADRMNCGACALACGGRQVCVAGSCQDSCPPGQTTCNGTCVNVLTSSESCGSCGNRCDSSSVCAGGRCVASCAVASDPDASAGDPDASADASGDGGAPATLTECRPVEGVRLCADLQSDRENCGACNVRCPLGQVCYSGRCAVLRPGRYPDLRAMGLNNQVSSVRPASGRDREYHSYNERPDNDRYYSDRGRY
jgi:hypothetical protein